MVCSDISLFADEEERKTVAFKDLGVGSYFATILDDGEVLQKIGNNYKANTLFLYTGEEESSITTTCPDDKVYALDVEIKWRFK